MGPWFLPTVRQALGPEVSLSYVLLRTELEVALARVRSRDGSGALDPAGLFQRVASGLERGAFAV